MKKLVFPLVLLLLTGCGQKDQKAADTSKKQQIGDTLKSEKTKEFFAEIDFPEGTDYDFGIYDERVVKTHDFLVRNPGKEPLIINKVETACSCTQASGPKQPILEGKTDVIHVTYDGNGFVEGFFAKQIRVHANIKERYVDLIIHGSYYNK